MFRNGQQLKHFMKNMVKPDRDMLHPDMKNPPHQILPAMMVGSKSLLILYVFRFVNACHRKNYHIGERIVKQSGIDYLWN
jgi:hypothetical protein